MAVLMPSVSLFAEETADFYSEDEAIFHEIEARESEPVSTVLTVSETPYELTMTKEAEKTAFPLTGEAEEVRRHGACRQARGLAVHRTS